jgi:choloylglycine hydrolase
MTRLARNFIVGLMLTALVLPALSCTTFVLSDGQRIYFGRNLDWDWSDGFVFVNPRNMSKRAFVLSTNAVHWTSKYGSVTFNQFGREMPFGGMNEAGLVVENMWLTATRYPTPDARPEINMLQWIQYQLDNHRTVEEVIASDRNIRLENTPVAARIHYYVCDASGDSATIEFLDGAMRVHRGENLPYRALANDPYATGLAAMRQRLSTTNPPAQSNPGDSISRFCRAAERASAFRKSEDPTQDIAYAFDTLNQVRQGNSTVWQIVYDVTRRKIHFKTLRNADIRIVDMARLDFECRSPALAVDIHAKSASPNSIEFSPLNPSDHRAYVERFFNQPSLHQTIGDVRLLVEPFLRTIQEYRCAE